MYVYFVLCMFVISSFFFLRLSAVEESVVIFIVDDLRCFEWCVVFLVSMECLVHSVDGHEEADPGETLSDGGGYALWVCVEG